MNDPIVAQAIAQATTRMRITLALCLVTCIGLLPLLSVAGTASADVFHHDEIEDTYTYGTWASKYTDAQGINGAILRWEDNGTATKTYSSVASNINQIQVRSRTSDRSVGRIWVAVVVDGTQLARQNIDATATGRTFTTRSWSVNLPSGTSHTIGIRAGSLEGTDAFLADYVELTGPTPPPPPPSTNVLWTAGAEKPLYQEWASLATSPNCARTSTSTMSDSRISRVTSPVKSGTYAYKATVLNNDACYGERAELGQGNPTRSDMLNRLFREGEERWISYDIRLGSDLPLDPPSWQVVTQLKQLGAFGSPVMELSVDNNAYYLRRTTNDPNNQWPAGFQKSFLLGPARTEAWATFTWHVKFSPHSNVGFLEMYGDLNDGRGMRLLLPKQAMSTQKIDPATGRAMDSHARIGPYRAPITTGNATIYYDGFAVGTTRAAAEAGQ